MSKKLYVGNLPYSVDDTQLQEMVAPYGETASATIIKDKFSGKSKGFGFVEFVNDADADKCMAELNGRDMAGRAMIVNEAKPLVPGGRPRSGGGDRRGGFGGDRGGRGGDRGGRGDRGGFGGGGGSRWRE